MTNTGLSHGGALLARQRLRLRLPWRLRLVPVCGCTDDLLCAWLAAGVPLPAAVLARRQRQGRGQHGRSWQAPAGGLWLSAALPWGGAAPEAERLPVLVVEALAAELRLLGLETSIKPPNDLMVANRKLAGVLTAINWRGGEIRHVRFGLGLNGRHPIRPPGVTLEQLLGPRCPPWPGLVGLGLRALERLCPETLGQKN